MILKTNTPFGQEYDRILVSISRDNFLHIMRADWFVTLVHTLNQSGAPAEKRIAERLQFALDNPHGVDILFYKKLTEDIESIT
ncbi:MAG: hypothetical protein LRY46_03215 [Candidatus Pacebacteria bacterium]|nr:hypothetical protein [Candidatus Paceibacterota bacterium]MCD8508061.1 hypothetical protein [Candidatus Paceibacterota bacterium]MCD8563834.1 hypothetical protein [Candidatus Paceibacterota bacterium]